MEYQRFYSLSPRQRGILCLAVLLDGHEAGEYLASDSLLGPALRKLAGELSTLEVQVRMPLLGSLMREAAAQVASETRTNLRQAVPSEQRGT